MANEYWAQNNCEKGTAAAYIRPCESSCRNYVHQCKVECCDESVQCTFEHSKKLSDDTAITTTGYAPHDGPSMFCTGSASRHGAFLSFVLCLCFFFCSADLGKKRTWIGLFVLSMVALATPAFALKPSHGSMVLATRLNNTALMQFGASVRSKGDW